MAEITIEGSISPAAGLARGERRTVQDSKAVRTYVRLGFANVVDEETGEPEPSPLPEPVKAPSRGASREDWAEFLATETDIVTEGKGRDVLVDEYDEWLKTHSAPSEPPTDGA
jgi:hypothetical protein